MIRKACWFADSELIQHQERVQVPQLDIKHVKHDLQKLLTRKRFGKREEF